MENSQAFRLLRCRSANPEINCTADASFGNASWTKIASGATQSGTCLTGYATASGAPLRYCNIDGTWSQTVTNACKRTSGVCPRAPLLPIPAAARDALTSDHLRGHQCVRQRDLCDGHVQHGCDRHLQRGLHHQRLRTDAELLVDRRVGHRQQPLRWCVPATGRDGDGRDVAGRQCTGERHLC